MSGRNTASNGLSRWRSGRALSTPVAAIAMVVVLVAVGAGSYLVLDQTKPTSTQSTSCAPAASYLCQTLLAAHDMTLLVPFQTTQAGTAIPFTASFSKGESSSSYSFNFGDGTPLLNSTSPTVNHAFSNPGTYIVSVEALVGGVEHDSYQSLTQITVEPSTASSHLGTAPTATAVITKNSTSAMAPSAVLETGGSVTVSATYSSAPTDPSFVSVAPKLVTDGGSAVTLSVANATSSSLSATATANSPGIYTVTLVAEATSGSTAAYQNFTWTVFVAAQATHAGLASTGSSSRSPHPGNLDVYEFIPGGSTSEDPAIDYESAGYEPILNVYQTLIQYNGSDSGPSYQNFVPELASCVPGSPQCTAEFQQNLSSGSNYTFVINGASQFYDPSTGNHWGVYPSDVLFSLVRTMAFATEPSFGGNNGWIVGQSLLSRGNVSWDNGIHATLNNTPAHEFASVQVNESGLCPAAAMQAPYHGCVTFDADANGVTWPYFLELVSQPFGSSIVPCGWFSAPAQAAGIPGWTYGLERSGDNGDHPCTLPGGATSSSQSAFQTNVSGMSPTEWDNWEMIGSGTKFAGSYWGNVQWSMVGSGPYYMASLKIAQSYLLKANPDYAQNPACTWSGCEPAAGTYAGAVSVLWEGSPLAGEEAYASGTADFAWIPHTDAALLLQLVQQGKAAATTFPSLSVYFFPFSLAFDPAAAQKYTSNPITVPSDFFANLAVRSFFTSAFPYATVQDTITTDDGIQFDFNYGGAIPQFMGQYYPTNISWPSGNPVSDAATNGSAAWWWHQLVTPGTAWYNSTVAACSASDPCQVPFFGETGAPTVDETLALWASELASLSGGAIKLNVLDIDFTDLVLNSLYSSPYQNPMPVYELGWAPDYPDPTDYMVPLYLPDGSYTHADAESEVLEGGPSYGVGQYNQSSCMSPSHPYTDLGYWSSLASTPGGVTNACQGTAYAAMTYGAELAAHLPNGAARILAYNMVEHIANALSLYLYWGQTNIVESYAPWIDGNSLNTNVAIGGSQDNSWYSVTGNGVLSGSS